MLALLRTRPPPHASPSTYARTLRTRPHLIPSYIKTWDPTYPVSVWQSGKLVDEKSQAQEGETDIRPTQEEIHEPNLVRSVEWDTQDRKPIHLGFSHRDRRLSYLLVLYESERENERLRAPLWRAYQLAKRYNKTLLHRLTDRAWQLLFSSRSAQVMGGQREKSQLSQLHRDMHKGRLTIPQRIQRIEYLFGHGLPKLALQEWSDFRNTESDYLKLGVKLYALAGFPGEARATMEELYQLYPTYDPSVMMLVFRAFTGSIVNQDRRDAGGIYLKMKKRLGDRVTIENYDSWLVGFLESGRLIDAKQVFKHMVKDGYVDVEGSAQAVTEVLKRFHMLCRLGTDISRMTNIALTAISVLPTAYHGHIFGHWMHIAVNYRAPEAVAQIFDMMVQRNSAPSTYHFNMLLRSLFRTKEDPHTMKAENIAWNMIDEARKIGPKIQASSMSAAEFIRANIVEATDQPMKLAGTPKADVNTFALLIQHHGKSSQWEHVDYLYRQLKILSFEPNAAIMNVLMDNKIRQGDYVEAWSMYKSFTEPEPGFEGVYPDGASIRMVWKNLRLALGDSATRDLPGLPSPRELLQETNDWRNLHRARHDQNRFRQGLAAADNGAITALIMHCFSYKQDIPGSLIALHILRQKFSIFPTVKAQEILMKQMAWVDLSLESSSITTQYYHSKSNARTLAHIIKIYDAIKEAREKRLLDAGIDRSLMTKEHLGDEYLNLLSEFTRFMLKRQYGSEYAEDMILAAKCSVGAPELTTGDVNAWEIP